MASWFVLTLDTGDKSAYVRAHTQPTGGIVYSYDILTGGSELRGERSGVELGRLTSAGIVMMDDITTGGGATERVSGGRNLGRHQSSGDAFERATGGHEKSRLTGGDDGISDKAG